MNGQLHWQALIDLLQGPLRESERPVLSALDSELRVVTANAGLLEVLGLPELPAGRELAALLPAGAMDPGEILRAMNGDSKRLVLSAAHGNEALHVTLHPVPPGWLLVGAPVPTTAASLVEQLTRLNNDNATLTRALQKEKAALERAQIKIQKLQGLIPICAGCKKIRDDTGYWSQVEEYLHHHAGTEFSHGMCPECYETFCREMERRKSPQDDGG